MKRLLIIVTLLMFALFFFAGCTDGENTAYPNSEIGNNDNTVTQLKLITGDEAKERLDRGDEIIFVDVRTLYDYEKMRIPGSILIPLEEYEELVPSLLPDKNAFIVVYCDVGGQSGRLAELMTEMGYQDVYQLGKLRNWHYEVERGPK